MSMMSIAIHYRRLPPDTPDQQIIRSSFLSGCGSESGGSIIKSRLRGRVLLKPRCMIDLLSRKSAIEFRAGHRRLSLDFRKISRNEVGRAMRVVLVCLCVLGLAGCSSAPDPREKPLRETISQIRMLATQSETKQLMVRETIGFGMVDQAVELSKLPSDLIQHVSKTAQPKTDSSDGISSVTKRDNSDDESSASQTPQSDACDSSISEKRDIRSTLMFKPPLPSKESTDTQSEDRKNEDTSLKDELGRFQAKLTDRVSSTIARQPIALMKSLTEEKSATQIAEWIGTRDRNIRESVSKVIGIANLSNGVDTQSKPSDSEDKIGSFPVPVSYAVPIAPWSVVIKGSDVDHKLVCEAYGEDSNRILFTESIPIKWR